MLILKTMPRIQSANGADDIGKGQCDFHKRHQEKVPFKAGKLPQAYLTFLAKILVTTDKNSKSITTQIR